MKIYQLSAAAVLALALSTASSASAQGTEGRLLTQAEVTMGRGVYPARSYARWTGASEYAVHDGKSWHAYDAATGAENEFTRPAKPEVMDGVPEGAGNVTMAPSSDAVAYTVGNSLYLRAGGKTVALGESEGPGIVYGQSVSRNEFGINEGIYWSDSGRKLAFYRKDESRVTEFPLLDINTRTGSLELIRYPMAGMDSERISLGIYDIESGKTVWAKVDDFGEDRYLTNISWSPEDKYVFIQVLDRAQENVHLNMYRSDNGGFVRTVLTEHDDRYVEPQDRLVFLKGTYEFIYRTDNRDGYRNLYLCDTLGTVRRITPVDADVEYVTNDGRKVWYTSAEVSPVENHLFCVDLKLGKAKAGASRTLKLGKAARLTEDKGWHTVSFNEAKSMFLDSWSSFDVPAVTDLRKAADGALVRNVSRAKDPLEGVAKVEACMGTVKSGDGRYDNWYRMFKPLNFDPSKKYPVIVYVYGGPHSQMVKDTWLGSVRMWEYLMAQKGYIVYVQDNRGTSNRGAEYEKAIHRQCGQCEMEDQMKGIEMLKSLPYVDADRIGVHGWSYGGFMTISLITNYPDVFKVAVAGGPVIDWKWYEVMYGERYMDTPQTNPEGFAKTSLINKAKDLKGKLLICQGAIDKTVVWEHSLSFIRECVKNNVQVDYFPYPCAEHNVMGKDRMHLMDKVTMYFEDYL